MAPASDLSSPEWWRRFNVQSVSLDAVRGTPGVTVDAASAFGAPRQMAHVKSAGVLLVGPASNALRQRPALAASIFHDLGLAGERALPINARTVGVQRSASGTHVVLQQRVAGADVIGATAKVHLGHDGSYVVSGRPIGDLASRRPSGRAEASPVEAGQAAARAFDVDPAHVVAVTRQIFPLAEGGGRWVYRVSMVVPMPYADVRVYVDASTLQPLLSFNIAAALRGTASVFEVNPDVTPDPRRVTLADIGPEPPDQLSGRRIRVMPVLRGPIADPARDFVRHPDDPDFDEPNAYFHVRRALRWFGPLFAGRRLKSPPFRPIKVYVRDPSAPNNALYGPTRGELRLGDFPDRPSARSADMIYHEFSHAVSDMVARLTRAPADSEARGLSEGYSDYFAETMLDDPQFGHWVTGGRGRNAADATLRFEPDFSGLEHDTGAVWAALLWSLRTRLGAAVTDRLAFESLFQLSQTSTFTDGEAALIMADRLLAHGASVPGPSEQAIADEWARRT